MTWATSGRRLEGTADPARWADPLYLAGDLVGGTYSSANGADFLSPAARYRIANYVLLSCRSALYRTP